MRGVFAFKKPFTSMMMLGINKWVIIERASQIPQWIVHKIIDWYNNSVVKIVQRLNGEGKLVFKIIVDNKKFYDYNNKGV